MISKKKKFFFWSIYARHARAIIQPEEGPAAPPALRQRLSSLQIENRDLRTLHNAAGYLGRQPTVEIMSDEPSGGGKQDEKADELMANHEEYFEDDSLYEHPPKAMLQRTSS